MFHRIGDATFHFGYVRIAGDENSVIICEFQGLPAAQDCGDPIDELA